MSTWQPIETAPKGVKILVLFEANSGHVEDATISDVGYSLFDGENLVSGNPTHWMPLPSLPAEGEMRDTGKRLEQAETLLREIRKWQDGYSDGTHVGAIDAYFAPASKVEGT
jgi:hypothetical protein